MALMKSEGKYLEALVYHKTYSLQDVDLVDLTTAALRHYEQGKDLPSIRQVLSYTSFTDQITYLRSNEEMADDLVEFYKTHNLTNELRKLYKEKSQYVEAARIAERIEDRISLLISAYKENYLNKDQTVRTELLGLFESVLKNLHGYTYMETEAEVLYYYSMLINKPDNLYRALESFNTINDKLGSLLVFKALIKMDSVNKNDAFRKISDVNKKFMEVLKSLFEMIDVMNNDKMDNYWVDGLLQKLGYGRNNRDWVVADNSSLKYFHKIAGLPPSISIHRVSKSQAMKVASKILLFILKDVIVKDYHSLVYQQIDMNVVCHMTNQCQDTTCRKLHQPPTHSNLQHGLDALFTVLAIDGLCSKTFQRLPEDLSRTSLWMELSPTHLHRLYNFLQAYKSFYHITKDQVAGIMLNIPLESKKALQKIMQKEWQENVSKSKVDINLYVGLSYISYLVNPKDPLIDELRQVRNLNQYQFEIFNMYHESLVFLYFKYNVKSFFYNTLQILRKRNIDCDTFCDILEVPILMMFAGVSATSSPKHPFNFSVPFSYIQKQQEWETLYNRRNDNAFTKAIEQLPVSKLQWDKTASFVKQACEVLANPDGMFKNLTTMIKEQDAKTKSVHHPLKISRLLCLYLSVLSNLKMGLDEYGRPIRDLFKDNLNVRKNTPFTTIFRSIGKVRNNDQAKELLIKLLKTREDSIRNCEWSKTNRRLVIPSLISNEPPKPTVRILQRGQDIEDKFQAAKNEGKAKNEDVDDDDEDDDDYNRTEDEELEEDEDLTNLDISIELELRDQQAKEKSIARRVYKQWIDFVGRKKAFRESALEKMKKYYAGLKIYHWFYKAYTRRRDACSYDDNNDQDIFSDEIFFNEICKVCKMSNAKTKEHVNSKQHQDKLKINKEEFDKMKDEYILLDVEDLEMEGLSMKFSTEYKVLQLAHHMKFPFSVLLQKAFDDFARKLKYLSKFQSIFSSNFVKSNFI